MQSHMALWAFRYVLGRQTYAPSMVQEELQAIWSHLDYETQECISRDLAEEINRSERVPGCLGSAFDKKGWLQFRDWVSAQEAEDDR